MKSESKVHLERGSKTGNPKFQRSQSAQLIEFRRLRGSLEENHSPLRLTDSWSFELTHTMVDLLLEKGLKSLDWQVIL